MHHTYFVGTMKCVGRIYQQTFIDTYRRVALAKLYTEKTALNVADMLNDRVIPFYDGQSIPLLRVLIDRGTGNIAARSKTTVTSSIWRWKTSTTQKPKRITVNLRALPPHDETRVLGYRL